MSSTSNLAVSVTQAQWFGDWEREVVGSFAAHREGWINDFMRALTAIGSPVGVGLMVVAVCGFVLLRGGWQPKQGWLLIPVLLAGAGISVTIAKAMAARPRPAVSLHAVGADADGFGFPSGHATLTAVGFGLIAVLLSRTVQRRLAAIVWAIAVLAVVMVGVSRVYLGAHWPTDIAAGWLLGTGWLLAWLLVSAANRARHETTGLRLASPRNDSSTVGGTP